MHRGSCLGGANALSGAIGQGGPAVQVLRPICIRPSKAAVLVNLFVSDIAATATLYTITSIIS
jgi:hypothetical protein